MRDKVNDGARIALMLESIANIEEFLSGVASYSEFVSSKLLCHAVIYNLQCIGESVYMLSKDFIKSHPGVDWEAIEGLRHVLVHDYYQVDIETIWGIIVSDLAPLKEYLLKERGTTHLGLIGVVSFSEEEIEGDERLKYILSR